MVSQIKINPQPPAKPEVLCDMCSESKARAHKSCLICLISYCKTHLEPHLNVAGLKKHRLIEPVLNLENRMCPKHDKPLELFCRTDHTCVCTICPLLEHKTHEFVSLNEEYDRSKASLKQTQEGTKTQVVQRRLRIQDIWHSVELSQKSADKETAVGLEAFTALIKFVQRSQDQFINRVQIKQRQIQKHAEDMVKELEQEISELKDRITEMEQLSASEDHLHFIQSLALLRPPPTLTDWTTVSFESDSFEGTAASALSKLQETVKEEFKKLFKAQFTSLQQFAVDVTLDPNSAHTQLVLSEDLKQVHHSSETRELPDSPERFTKCPCVVGGKSFSSGKFYFEVQVKGKTDWDLGVVKKSIKRNGELKANPKNGYWTIILRNEKHYIACAGPSVCLSLKRAPEKVGVFVEYKEGRVSFYDVDTSDLIFSFSGCSFTEELLPYFSPCHNVGGKNSTPLVISPVSKHI